MPVKREHSASPDLALVPTTPIKGRGHASATSSPKKPKTPKSKHEPPKSPLKLKSEPDPASAQLDDVGSNSDTGSARNSSSPDKYASRGRPGAKARIDASIKVIMGRYIVERGIAVADAEKLAGLTGLTVQQVRSQLAANRQNLHRQLLAHVESIEGKK